MYCHLVINTCTCTSIYLSCTAILWSIHVHVHCTYTCPVLPSCDQYMYMYIYMSCTAIMWSIHVHVHVVLYMSCTAILWSIHVNVRTSTCPVLPSCDQYMYMYMYMSCTAILWSIHVHVHLSMCPVLPSCDQYMYMCMYIYMSCTAIMWSIHVHLHVLYYHLVINTCTVHVLYCHHVINTCTCTSTCPVLPSCDQYMYMYIYMSCSAIMWSIHVHVYLHVLYCHHVINTCTVHVLYCHHVINTCTSICTCPVLPSCDQYMYIYMFSTIILWSICNVLYYVNTCNMYTCTFTMTCNCLVKLSFIWWQFM